MRRWRDYSLLLLDHGMNLPHHWYAVQASRAGIGAARGVHHVCPAARTGLSSSDAVPGTVDSAGRASPLRPELS